MWSPVVSGHVGAEGRLHRHPLSRPDQQLPPGWALPLIVPVCPASPSLTLLLVGSITLSLQALVRRLSLRRSFCQPPQSLLHTPADSVRAPPLHRLAASALGSRPPSPVATLQNHGSAPPIALCQHYCIMLRSIVATNATSAVGFYDRAQILSLIHVGSTRGRSFTRAGVPKHFHGDLRRRKRSIALG
ncbi:hypothetical protein NDU88_000700 [Pleurodeles waltl]|uniref:Uncharacterized protein n=1 Tax=Pleurodeles waltl TaxID=8319 RepID=A0AAV7U4Z8_PLEWA|nr:hypothetical protein NDU88_000700 [Pleurodeles waltl]